MLIFIIIAAAVTVAFANGANDNAKGIAPLVGSRMAPLPLALRWANLTTLLGALAAVWVALTINQNLVKAFGGGGLLPGDFKVSGLYLVAVALGAAATVLLATRLGIPVSTTHALTGALIGAGVVAVGPGRLAWMVLEKKFVLPLLLSPVLAALATLALYPAVHRMMRSLAVGKTMCLCVEARQLAVVAANGSLLLAETGRVLTVDEARQCETRFTGMIFTWSAQRIYTIGQYLTSGLVSFARGMNDAPKIAGVVVAAGALAVTHSLVAVALFMLVGGLLFTRRVAATMAEKITAMDGEQALVGSAVTATLVLLASYAGLPVSTTHVAVGALIGIGFATRTARWGMIGTILAAWVTTLPLSGAIAAVVYALIKGGS